MPSRDGAIRPASETRAPARQTGSGMTYSHQIICFERAIDRLSAAGRACHSGASSAFAGGSALHGRSPGSPALAALLAGALVGVVAFGTSLFAGSSLLVSIGVYSLAGFFASCAIMALGFLRRRTAKRKARARGGLVAPGRSDAAMRSGHPIPEDWLHHSVARATRAPPPDFTAYPRLAHQKTG